MKFLYTLILILPAVICFGQQNSPAQKAHDTYLFKNDGTSVSSIDSADYIRLVFEPDEGSKLYNVEEYYKNKQPRFVGKSTRINPVVLEDQSISYYPNGKKKQVVDYHDNMPTGTSYQFYPNGRVYMLKEYLSVEVTDTNQGLDSLIKAEYDSTGRATIVDGNGYYTAYSEDFKTIIEEGAVKESKPDGHWKGIDQTHSIKYEEEYINGKIRLGTSTNRKGTVTSYYTRWVSAQYPGGVNALGNFLGINIRYPQYARDHHIQGRVVLRFVIAADGTMHDIMVIQSVDDSVDKEAIRVISQTPTWLPFLKFGVPIPAYYTIPISFTLAN